MANPDSFWPSTPGQTATLACLLEASAPKPGNVHRSADFDDVTFYDFQTSALVTGNVFDACSNKPLGETILAAVEATKSAVGTNTNLGLILLLAPLVKTCQRIGSSKLTGGLVGEMLSELTPVDGGKVFQAIAAAKPGGMGQADSMDVNRPVDQVDLMAAMTSSSERDSIAKQYTHQFCDVFDIGIKLLKHGLSIFPKLHQATVFAHIAWIAHQGDSLIFRKLGAAASNEARDRAATALASLDDLTVSKLLAQDRRFDVTDQNRDAFWHQVGTFDFWLRSDGHRRNPGTTADLMGATLFVAIHNRVHPQLIFDSASGRPNR